MTNELEVNELIEQLEELLEQKNYRAMKPLLDELPAADIGGTHNRPRHAGLPVAAQGNGRGGFQLF